MIFKKYSLPYSIPFEIFVFFLLTISLYIPKPMPEKKAKIDISKITYKKTQIKFDGFSNGINSESLIEFDETPAIDKRLYKLN